MDIVERNISVHMIRPDLLGLHHHPLPPGYFTTWYQPGYEAHWLTIHKEADRFSPISMQLYRDNFGYRHDALKLRQCYLFDTNETPIGTATAWFDDDYHGSPAGRIHWVAIVPEAQGRGLSKPLLWLTCNRLLEMGHERAYLVTGTARVPAINLYLGFGFVPHIRSADDHAVWLAMKQHLKHDYDLPDPPY